MRQLPQHEPGIVTTLQSRRLRRDAQKQPPYISEVRKWKETIPNKGGRFKNSHQGDWLFWKNQAWAEIQLYSNIKSRWFRQIQRQKDQRKRKEEGRRAKEKGEKRECVTNVDKFKIELDFLSIKAEKKKSLNRQKDLTR